MYKALSVGVAVVPQGAHNPQRRRARRWRSFHRGGSVAVYVGLYAMWFLFSVLHALSGVTSMVLYLAYMALSLWGLFLATGTVGFLASFYFTYQIFAAVKAD